MKIAIFDSYAGKFTTGMQEWWEKQGNEVKRDTYYDPEKVDWADVSFFHTCDNNLLSATNPDQALRDEWLVERRKTIPWDLHEMDLSKKKIVVQPIDIEVWGGSHAHDNMWDVVDHCIFNCKHIRDMAMSDSRMQGHKMTVDTVPMGVDMDKWTFKKRQPGKKVAIVSEKWIIKGMQNILQIAYELPDYEFHWLGKWSNDYPYFRTYVEDFIKRHNLNFVFTDWVDNLDEWLEDKNYLLHAGMKETFVYAFAEAMAKGIKPVPHHFYGAENLWPGLTWNTPTEAVKMITEDKYDSDYYRQYLIGKGYTLESMMNAITKIINS